MSQSLSWSSFRYLSSKLAIFILILITLKTFCICSVTLSVFLSLISSKDSNFPETTSKNLSFFLMFFALLFLYVLCYYCSQIVNKGKLSKFQMCICSLLFVAVLIIPSVTFCYFLDFKNSPVIFTSTVLILSAAFIFTSRRKKTKVSVQNAAQSENSICDSGGTENPISDTAKNENPVSESAKNESNISDLARKENPICGLAGNENRSEKKLHKDLQPEEVNIRVEEFVQEIEVRGSIEKDFPSDSEESSDGDSVSSESFELDWICSSNNTNVSREEVIFSSGSVSDSGSEDGLIEIAIPGSDSVQLSEEKEILKQKKQSNMSSILPESIIKQQDLVELLADINEINEEENLIEIDISMGSIKCSRFEIEA